MTRILFLANVATDPTNEHSAGLRALAMGLAGGGYQVSLVHGSGPKQAMPPTAEIALAMQQAEGHVEEMGREGIELVQVPGTPPIAALLSAFDPAVVLAANDVVLAARTARGVPVVAFDFGTLATALPEGHDDRRRLAGVIATRAELLDGPGYFERAIVCEGESDLDGLDAGLRFLLEARSAEETPAPAEDPAQAAAVAAYAAGPEPADLARMDEAPAAQAAARLMTIPEVEIALAAEQGRAGFPRGGVESVLYARRAELARCIEITSLRTIGGAQRALDLEMESGARELVVKTARRHLAILMAAQPKEEGPTPDEVAGQAFWRKAVKTAGRLMNRADVARALELEEARSPSARPKVVEALRARAEELPPDEAPVAMPPPPAGDTAAPVAPAEGGGAGTMETVTWDPQAIAGEPNWQTAVAACGQLPNLHLIDQVERAEEAREAGPRPSVLRALSDRTEAIRRLEAGEAPPAEDPGAGSDG